MGLVPVDPRIKNLKSTTFQGTRCTRRRLTAMQETVQTLPRPSRHELAQRLCVHHRWQTPKGRNRLAFALRLLQAPERLGILSLPARQSPGRGSQNNGIDLTYECDESSCAGTGSLWFQHDATPLRFSPASAWVSGAVCPVTQG